MLWDATRRLYKAGERQIDVAEKAANAAEMSARAMISTERPYLYPEPPRLIVTDNYYSAAYLFINIGRGPAIIRGGRAAMVFAKSLPATPELDDAPVWRDEHPLPSFVTYESPIPVSCPPFFRAELDALAQKTMHFFVFGFVEYEDVYGSTHERGFCYQFLESDPHVWGGEAYNYECTKSRAGAPKT